VGDREIPETYSNSASKNTSETDIFRHGPKSLFTSVIGGILVLFIYIYITRLASKEIFSPSNKIHREVGRGNDLSATLYSVCED